MVGWKTPLLPGTIRFGVLRRQHGGAVLVAQQVLVESGQQMHAHPWRGFEAGRAPVLIAAELPRLELFRRDREAGARLAERDARPPREVPDRRRTVGR